MRFRWKLLILLIVIAMVPVLVMRTFGVHGLRLLGTELVSRTSENLVVGAQQQLHLVVDSYSQMLWQGREQLELALLVQAKEVERALAHDPEVTGEVYFAADIAAGRHVPIDLSPSADHFREQDGARPTMMTVAYSAQVFALAPDVRRTDVAADLARLDQLTPVYQDLHRRLPGNVIWHYTCLANGLHSAYPAHGDLAAGYDPRRQFWYQEAFKLKTPWVDQFVDPETGQKVVAAVKTVKRPDGTTAGVTALIIPVSRIFQRRVLVNNIPAETTAFMVYLSSEPDGGKKGARVLAQIDFDDSRQRVWRAPSSSEWLITDENAVYDETRHPLIPGNIIIIGTDGIWEAPDQQGDMFGKDRLQDLVRTHAGRKARQILEAVITAVEAFQGPGRQRQDDITLTIIKVEQAAS